MPRRTTRRFLRPGARFCLGRKIKGHNDLKAYIPPHIEDTGPDTGWHDRVIKILQTTHVRLVVHICQIGAFHKQLDELFPRRIDQVDPKARTQQVIARRIGLRAIGGKEAVLCIEMIEAHEGISILPFADPLCIVGP